MGLTTVQAEMNQTLGIPAGMVAPFAGTSAPSGWLACDGSLVSRTTYATLFAAIGVTWGSGDGSTTFSLPDLRYKFVRGYGANTQASGSGSASSNNATFTSHGFTVTGRKVRMGSGALTGLSTNTDYWLIVVDANTLAFATSRANAFAGTKIAISGANTAVINQWEDPDITTREANASGGNSGALVGSVEQDALQGHCHERNRQTNTAGGGGGGRLDQGTGNNTGAPADLSPYGAVRASSETRPQNAFMLYIIKT